MFIGMCQSHVVKNKAKCKHLWNDYTSRWRREWIEWINSEWMEEWKSGKQSCVVKSVQMWLTSLSRVQSFDCYPRPLPLSLPRTLIFYSPPHSFTLPLSHSVTQSFPLPLLCSPCLCLSFCPSLILSLFHSAPLSLSFCPSLPLVIPVLCYLLPARFYSREPCLPLGEWIPQCKGAGAGSLTGTSLYLRKRENKL